MNVGTSGAEAPRASDARQRPSISLVATGAGLLGLILAGVTVCPFALVTRQPCPGCGLSRATMALARGDLPAALHFHPLVPVVLPAAAAYVALGLWRWLKNGRFESFAAERGRLSTAIAVVLGVLLFGVWIARFFGAFGGPVPV